MRGEKLNFDVDQQLKGAVKEKIITTNKVLLRVGWIEKIVFIIVLVLTVFFPIYCINTGKYLSTITGTDEKSYFIVIMFTAIIFTMGMTLCLLIHVLKKRLAGAYSGGRTDERIEIIDNKLIYLFRIKFQTSIGQINIVVINLDEINRITYDKENRKIRIQGKMYEEIIEKYVPDFSIDENNMKKSEVEIYDYFKPSLYEFLEKNVQGGIQNG